MSVLRSLKPINVNNTPVIAKRPWFNALSDALQRAGGMLCGELTLVFLPTDQPRRLPPIDQVAPPPPFDRPPFRLPPVNQVDELPNIDTPRHRHDLQEQRFRELFEEFYRQFEDRCKQQYQDKLRKEAEKLKLRSRDEIWHLWQDDDLDSQS
jgi:hypothetical protein